MLFKFPHNSRARLQSQCGSFQKCIEILDLFKNPSFGATTADLSCDGPYEDREVSRPWLHGLASRSFLKPT
jgi:hypothetical protein